MIWRNKIVCNDIQIKDSYVGSCQSFRTRKTNHKSACNNETSRDYNVNVYQFIRANGGWANWNMIAIEQVNYNIKHELLLRERFHLERLGATLNKHIPSRTEQEYKKAYFEENRTEINKKAKELITCECGKSSTKCHISRHKQSKNHRQYQQIYEFIYS